MVCAVVLCEDVYKGADATIPVGKYRLKQAVLSTHDANITEYTMAVVY